MNLNNVSVFCFLASYAVALGLEWTRLMRRFAISRWLVLLFGVAGFVAQTAYLLVRSQRLDHLPPLLGSTHDWLLVLAWIVVLLYLFLTSVDRELAVGVFLLPIVLLFVGASYFVSQQTNRFLEGHRGLAMLHASLLVFGIAGVVASFVLSLMYVLQHRRLKHHQAQLEGVALPSLARLARWNWWFVVVSVPLLTLGLGSGVALGLTTRTTAPELSFADPLVIGHGVVWLVLMALFVWLLTTRRSTGRQVAALTLWAGGFLLAILIGLQVLTHGGLSSFHGGGMKSSRRSGADGIMGDFRFQISDSKFQICQLKSDISHLKSKICNLKSEIGHLKSAICNLRFEICKLKFEICPLNFPSANRTHWRLTA